MPPAWSVQVFEWETGTTSESHATVVSDSPCGTVGGQRTVGIMRSLRGSYAGILPGVDESLRSSGRQTRGAPGITTALDLPPGVELSGAETRLDSRGGQAFRTTAAGRDDGVGGRGDLPAVQRQDEVEHVP